MAAVRSTQRAADTFLAVSRTADIYNLHISICPDESAWCWIMARLLMLISFRQVCFAPLPHQWRTAAAQNNLIFSARCVPHLSGISASSQA